MCLRFGVCTKDYFYKSHLRVGGSTVTTFLSILSSYWKTILFFAIVFLFVLLLVARAYKIEKSRTAEKNLRKQQIMETNKEVLTLYAERFAKKRDEEKMKQTKSSMAKKDMLSGVSMKIRVTTIFLVLLVTCIIVSMLIIPHHVDRARAKATATTSTTVATTQYTTTTTTTTHSYNYYNDYEDYDDDYDLLRGQTLDMTVYITPTGKKYHYRDPCGRGDYYPITLEEALDGGYDPCGKCVLR